MKPFLKWAGGKRWLAKEILEKIPQSYNCYIEPFLGSAAVFFELQPANPILSDANRELIETYQALRDNPKEIYNALLILQKDHCKELYYKIRSSSPKDKIESAIRFIYLNRTCWNGLYRVNYKNEFNVPMGSKTTIIFDNDDFEAISEALHSAKISSADFEDSIDEAALGDLIYVDPPYTVKHNSNGFIKYNQRMFSWDDQVRLRNSLVRARERGCHIIMSNADHSSIWDLYSSFEDSSSVPRASVIAGSSAARGETSEFLMVHHG